MTQHDGEDADQLQRWALLQREFVSNLSNPELALERMPRSSMDRCWWRCSVTECEHEWSAVLRFRARRQKPSGCPKCWRKRNRAPGPGESLTDVNPVLAKQFRRNWTRPERGPDSFRPYANDVCEWECEQGHSYPAKVANRSNGRGCPKCSGHGRSFFECKVAVLVEAASGLKVELDHRMRLPGRRRDRFDLFLPTLGLLIDLDPAWVHAEADSIARDSEKTRAAMAFGLDLVRIRECGLPPLPVAGLAHYEAGPGVDPEEWAAVIGSVLRGRGEPWKDLDAAQVQAALEKASQMWQEVVARPTISAFDEAPHLADEFVANLTNPGRGLDQMPPGCNDVCAWRCLKPGCGNEWEVALVVRAPQGRGCRKCGWQKTGADNTRPGPGESLAEVNPALADQLVEVVHHPGWTALDLLPSSNKSCWWKCPVSDCGHRGRSPKAG